MSDIHLSCTDCDERFLDYFEDSLDATARSQLEAHVASCARCQGIVRDVEAIRRQAAAMPDLQPSRDLWSGIESRIEPPVVSITQRRTRAPWSRTAIGVAAAALVVISSSITWVASRGVPRHPAPRHVVENPQNVPVPGEGNEIGGPSEPGAPEAVEAGPRAEHPSARAARPRSTGRGTQTVPTVRSTTPAARSPRTALVKNVPAPTASEVALAPEIAQLQKTIRQRRDQLDPETVRVVEENLHVIDLAVEQAKAALRKDPASGFLNEQLDGALQKKVELLRTVALLPSRS